VVSSRAGLIVLIAAFGSTSLPPGVTHQNLGVAGLKIEPTAGSVAEFPNATSTGIVPEPMALDDVLPLKPAECQRAWFSKVPAECQRRFSLSEDN
jgi:hypothetical protein